MPIVGLKEANEQIMRGGVTDCSEEQLLLTLLKSDGGGKYDSGLEYCKAILARFGGLRGLARARPEEMATFTGLGGGMVTIIKAALELGSRAQRSGSERVELGSIQQVFERCEPMRHLDHEEMRVLALDTRLRLMREDTIYRGTLNTTVIRTGELFRPALAVNAAAVIIVHNHPSGDPTPSPEDIIVTRTMYAAGSLLDIDVIDHLIVGDGTFTSMKALGYRNDRVDEDAVAPIRRRGRRGMERAERRDQRNLLAE